MVHREQEIKQLQVLLSAVHNALLRSLLEAGTPHSGPALVLREAQHCLQTTCSGSKWAPAVCYKVPLVSQRF